MMITKIAQDGYTRAAITLCMFMYMCDVEDTLMSRSWELIYYVRTNTNATKSDLQAKKFLMLCPPFLMNYLRQTRRLLAKALCVRLSVPLSSSQID